MATPIWRDEILTLGGFVNYAYSDFSILYNGNEIYAGRIYARPDGVAELKINDICANFIRNAFPTTFPNTGGEAQSYIYEFTVEIIEYREDGSEYGTETVQVQFFYDWSYDYTKDYTATPILSAPIVRSIPRNAPLIYTATSGTTYIELVDNSAYSRAFNSAFDVGSVSTLAAQSVANNIFNLAELATPSDKSVKIYGDDGSAPIIYSLIDECRCRYMLYYLNAYGGWDFIPIEGKDKQTDSYTRNTFGQTYNNDQSRNRGLRNYRNDIARKWELHTLWIDDAGAQNMHHLLGSIDVYLYNLKEGVLHPVTIDNSSCEYKTYSNNGNELVSYDIEVSLAKTLTRR